jgi:hypothetical protein
MGLRSGIRDPVSGKTYSGSRIQIQKCTGSRIRNTGWYGRTSIVLLRQHRDCSLLGNTLYRTYPIIHGFGPSFFNHFPSFMHISTFSVLHKILSSSITIVDKMI